MGINAVVLTGRATRDPEIRHFNNGDQIAEFSIAVQHGKDKSSFFDLKLWNKAAEIAGEYVRKGNMLGVTGELRQETWETSDGQKRSKVVIVGHKIELLQPKQSGDQDADSIFS